MSSFEKSPIEYDVVVVGASFAGLSFASVASVLGMRVLLVERDERVGGIVRTTGVLFSDVLDVVDVPQRYLMNAVRRILLQAPGQSMIEVSSRAYRFYMADVSGMLQWMAQEATERGATLCCNTLFNGVSRRADGIMDVMLRRTSGKGNEDVVCTQLLIGADGTRSKVAECMGLERNTRYLAGAEWLLEGEVIDRETFSLIMSQQLAPGYCMWLAPHGDMTALGVAGHAHQFKPAESLHQAGRVFEEVADMSKMRVIERKAGVIPVGGRLRHVYRNDERGHALLLGDAAGLCGAATGGGIYPALICGRLAAHAAASEVLNGQRGAIQSYLRNLAHAGRLGQYLRIEDWLRWVLDRMQSDADVGLLYGLFGTPSGQRILQQTLLETPIIGMDGNFFTILRSLLKKHPHLYSSTIQALWQRVFP